MSFQLAEAYVQLSEKGFNTVTGAINGVRGKLGGLVSYATGPLAVAMAGIGAGAGVAGMISLAASVEQTEVQFKTLLGSVDAAGKMIKDLQAFGASTPFEFASLADAAKTLLAFGTSQEQIIPAMRVLGDVAAATGSNIGELSQIYGKVQARGALMTESLDQFNERGIPVAKLLADSMGKTGEEIRLMASEGKISFGDLQTALVTMTSEGGIAFEGMVAQSQTLGGVWSTFSDNMTVLMGDIGKAIVEGFDLAGVTTDLTAFVGRIQTEWVPSITDAFGRLRSILQPWRDTIGSMIEPMMDLAVNMDLYHAYITTSWGNSLNNMWQRVSTFFNNAVTLGGWFVNNIGTFFVNMYNNAGQIFGNMVQMFKNYWSALWDFIRGRGFNIDFSPMVDSFNTAMKGIELPELKSPELNALQGDLDRIAGQLAARQEARDKAARDQQAKAAEERIEDLKVQTAEVKKQDEAEKKKESTAKKTHSTEKQVTKEKEKQRIGFSSLAELADRVYEYAKEQGQAGLGLAAGGGVAQGAIAKAGAGAAMGNAPVEASVSTRAQVGLLQQQVTHLATLAALASGSGLRVSQQGTGGRIGVPAASVQFGVTGG